MLWYGTKLKYVKDEERHKERKNCNAFNLSVVRFPLSFARSTIYHLMILYRLLLPRENDHHQFFDWAMLIVQLWCSSSFLVTDCNEDELNKMSVKQAAAQRRSGRCPTGN